jgi:hypothetical protein
MAKAREEFLELYETNIKKPPLSSVTHHSIGMQIVCWRMFVAGLNSKNGESSGQKEG